MIAQQELQWLVSIFTSFCRQSWSLERGALTYRAVDPVGSHSAGPPTEEWELPNRDWRGEEEEGPIFIPRFSFGRVKSGVICDTWPGLRLNENSSSSLHVRCEVQPGVT
jgi:hypothetical protein